MSANLNIMSWNCNGVSSKRKAIDQFVTNSVISKCLHIVGLVETHCSQYLLPTLDFRLRLIQCKDPSGRSVGLAIWAKSNLKPHPVPTWSDRRIAIDIEWKSDKYRIILVYGFSNNSDNDELISEID